MKQMTTLEENQEKCLGACLQMPEHVKITAMHVRLVRPSRRNQATALERDTSKRGAYNVFEETHWAIALYRSMRHGPLQSITMF